MKKIILMLMVSFVIILGACTETENKEMESIESTETNTQEVSDENNLEENETSAEPEKESKKEIDLTSVDNDNLKAVVTSITKIEDKEWDEEQYEISIEVDNKREDRSEEHTSELQSRFDLVCRLLLEKKKIKKNISGQVNTQLQRNQD